MKPNEAYLKERGFEVMDRKPFPDEQRPYVEINTPADTPGNYDVWLATSFLFGYHKRFRKADPELSTAEGVTRFIAETAQRKTDVPRGRRFKVFTSPECRDLALFLPEMYGGIL